MLFSFGEQRMGVGAVDTEIGKAGNIPQCLGDEIVLWAASLTFSILSKWTQFSWRELIFQRMKGA